MKVEKVTAGVLLTIEYGDVYPEELLKYERKTSKAAIRQVRLDPLGGLQFTDKFVRHGPTSIKRVATSEAWTMIPYNVWVQWGMEDNELGEYSL